MDPARDKFPTWAIITTILISVLLVGFLVGFVYSFSWQPPEEEHHHSEILNLYVRAYADTDRIEVKLNEGPVNWSEYIVKGNDINLTTSSTISIKGETAILTGIPLGKGTEFELKIIKQSENIVVSLSTVKPE